jgi:hypothetical protein
VNLLDLGGEGLGGGEGLEVLDTIGPGEMVLREQVDLCRLF